MSITPVRQVRALHDDERITVYQAYDSAIAEAALAAGRFVPPFKTERMTWIKPSFLWMMYRCGWGRKAGQERILAIRITRAGFEQALAQACLSHFERDVHNTQDTWKRLTRERPVRVQWDPERSLSLAPLEHRSIQIGLGAPVVPDYVDGWTTGITDVTPLAHAIHARVRADDLDGARALLPAERPYPLPAAIARDLRVTG
ncbi:DUF4291 domain-containing protein [Kineosporia sp. NBRC 101731]|uniref:DUF4291 domain-containing protein n=1 Tax=Kineosporia sp. NBRC 101731 TaxID=3032199 RepID=UPI002555EEC8|nr:DUF4291 domain-containing protein [Kineosporia sp. NBRC 101731]